MRALLTLPTASRVLGHLVDAGLLIREYGRIDRRKTFLALTPLGQERLEESHDSFPAGVVRRLEALSPNERAHLHAALTRISDIISERSD
jgi:DNA-binding MarR family transcriptional regulator